MCECVCACACVRVCVHVRTCVYGGKRKIIIINAWITMSFGCYNYYWLISLVASPPFPLLSLCSKKGQLFSKRDYNYRLSCYFYFVVARKES